MSKPQSLEEAWFRLSAHPPCIDEMCSLCEIEEDAARALLLLGLEEARAIDEAPTMARAGLYEKQQRRIEALGK